MGSSAKKSEGGGGGGAQKKRSTSSGSTESSGESKECSSSSTEEKKGEGGSLAFSPTILGWPIGQAELLAGRKSVPSSKPVVISAKDVEKRDEVKLKMLGSKLSEMDMMKERFAKLLLGEDMSGSGKGVCTALAISNAITNLCASIFGQLWRLEPLPDERKAMWQREMECLLCVGDHIVELIPSSQTFPDGRKLEVMTCRQRLDIFINLPALHKLDDMLLDILDCFKETEFWYVDQGIVASDAAEGLAKTVQRQEEKWWLPVPRVPAGGLSENSRKHLNHSRESTCQILKAAMAINGVALSEMEVPDSYLDALPKHGRASLGDMIYRYVASDQFSADCLLDCLDLSSEHVALEIANRVEASIYVWRRRAHTHSRPPLYPNRSTTKPSWGTMVKDLMMVDADKREVLAEKAERLLLSLKHRFPGLSQTVLDASKIQFNKDVGKSIIESYSRVLESLAFNIVARIDDILYVDDLTRHTDKLSSPSPAVNLIAQRKSCFPYSVPVSTTPYRSTFSTPSFSPSPATSFIGHARGDITPYILNDVKPPRRGFGVRRVLDNYLGMEPKPKSSNSSSMESISSSSTSSDGSDHRNGSSKAVVAK